MKNEELKIPQSRNLCFDITKGFLILLVIIGHFMLGSTEDNPLREIIYFFHMPLFLAITGYFISQSTLEKNIFEILKKYQNRLIIPTLVAFLFYNFDTNIIKYIKNVFNVYPYYHLWYIPALFIFIFYLKFLTKISQYRVILWVIMGFFVLISIYFETYSQWTMNKGMIFHYLGDKRFYYFFSYFGLGYLLKINKIEIPKIYIFSGIILGLGLYFLADFPFSRGIARVLTNYCLIYLIINFSVNNATLVKPNFFMDILQKMGKVSLPIYLWHIVISNFGKKVFIEPMNTAQYNTIQYNTIQYNTIQYNTIQYNTIQYYLFEIVAMSIFVWIVIKLEGKNKYIDRLFYGK